MRVVLCMMLLASALAVGQDGWVGLKPPPLDKDGKVVVFPDDSVKMGNMTIMGQGGLLMTCEPADDKDWSKVKKCKIADGHTLDEVVNALAATMKTNGDMWTEDHKRMVDGWTRACSVATEYQKLFNKCIAISERHVKAEKKALGEIQDTLTKALPKKVTK